VVERKIDVHELYASEPIKMANDFDKVKGRHAALSFGAAAL
jgi:hypothetical protein